MDIDQKNSTLPIQVIWSPPHLVIIIPVVVIVFLIILSIIGFIIWKRRYNWRVFPVKLSLSKDTLSEDDLTIQGTSISNLSSIRGSTPTLRSAIISLDMSANSSLATTNEASANMIYPETPRSTTSTGVKTVLSKAQKFFSTDKEIKSDLEDGSEQTSEQTSVTSATKNKTKQELSKAKVLRELKESLSLRQKYSNKENGTKLKENAILDNGGEPKADEVTNFVLDRSVMGWSIQSDLEPEVASELDKSLSPEIAQRTDKCFQDKINEAVKVVEKMNFSLPDDATEEEKEKNRLAFHKMVWVVANDDRKLSKT